MAAQTQQPARLPTEDQPDFGRVTLGGVLISEVAHWVEDGVHVLRSTEYDIIAADEDFSTALQKFIDEAEDVADTYAELSDDEATLAEAEQGLELMKRQAAAYKAILSKLERRLFFKLSVSRRRRHSRGFERSAPRSSPPQSVV